MNVRSFRIVMLTLCVLGGLIAGIVTPALAQTLPLSATPGAARVPVPPRPTPIATASVQARPTQPASGLTVLASDTFQRPDQPLWGRASDGHPWEGDANTNPAFSLHNGTGQITGAGTLQAVLNVASANAEILIRGSISQFDANGGINLGGVLRWRDVNNWYKVLIDGQHLQLLAKVKGTKFVLKSIPFQAVANTSYSLRFRVLGSNLFAKAWPSAQTEPAGWMLVFVDPQLTGGIGGIRVLLTPGVTIRITSFLETSVPVMV
jgi:hypothetical protein